MRKSNCRIHGGRDLMSPTYQMVSPRKVFIWRLVRGCSELASAFKVGHQVGSTIKSAFIRGNPICRIHAQLPSLPPWLPWAFSHKISTAIAGLRGRDSCLYPQIGWCCLFGGNLYNVFTWIVMYVHMQTYLGAGDSISLWVWGQTCFLVTIIKVTSFLRGKDEASLPECP